MNFKLLSLFLFLRKRIRKYPQTTEVKSIENCIATYDKVITNQVLKTLLNEVLDQ